MVDKSAHGGGRDAATARIAERQHGIVTTAQLRAIGFSAEGIAKRARTGRFHRIHRGVYAVGHQAALSQEAKWMAAVLACGEGAVLSHGSAAALWGLLRPFDGPVEVSVPTAAGRAKRRGIRIHRRPSFIAAVADTDASAQRTTSTDFPAERTTTAPRLTTYRNRIPVTTVARTLEDLETSVPSHLYRRARRQAELAGYPLGATPTDRTRSDLERDFLRLCRRHNLPAPEVNVRVGRLTVDFLWPTQHLVVETDGYRYHRGATAFEDDHQRDLALRRLGLTVHRYTGAQLRNHPAEVVAELGEVLSGATGEAPTARAP